jgi:hypothetical protein
MVEVAKMDRGKIREILDRAGKIGDTNGWEQVILLQGDELPNGGRDAVEVTMSAKGGRPMFSFGHGSIDDGEYSCRPRIPRGALRGVREMLDKADKMVNEIIRSGVTDDRPTQVPKAEPIGSPRRTRRDPDRRGSSRNQQD